MWRGNGDLGGRVALRRGEAMHGEATDVVPCRPRTHCLPLINWCYAIYSQRCRFSRYLTLLAHVGGKVPERPRDGSSSGKGRVHFMHASCRAPTRRAWNPCGCVSVKKSAQLGG